MARTKFLVPMFLGLAAVLAGCSPSPLYVDRAAVGTFGEVPRDGRGEPIWSAIGPAPATPTDPNAPVATAAMQQPGAPPQ